MKGRMAIALTVAVLSLSACKENVEQLASKHMAAAEQAFSEGSYEIARQQIDSIRILYPNAVQARRSALELSQQIDIREQERTIAYEQTLLDSARLRLKEMLPAFTLEKNAEYQDLGNWVIPSRNAENNLGRSYLRAQVDEKGRLTLISTYTGSQYIHHKKIKLALGGVYCESLVSDNVYEYKDLDVCYEKCNLQGQTLDQTAAFIAAHRDDSKLRLTLVGEKRNVDVELTAADRKAIGSLYDLSQLLLAIEEHESVKAEANRRLDFVNGRIAAAAAKKATGTDE